MASNEHQMTPKPSVVATVICDTFYQDKDNKFILVGTFNQVRAPIYPYALPTFGIYVALSSVPVSGRLKAILQHEDERYSYAFPEWIVHRGPDDRTMVVEFAGRMEGLLIPRPGKYDINIYWDGIFLGGRSFEAHQLSASGA